MELTVTGITHDCSEDVEDRDDGCRLYIVNHDVHAAHGTDLWLRFVSAMLQWLSTCTQTSWSFAIICPQNPGDREETESIVRLGFQPAYVDHAGGDDGSDSEPFSEFWYLIPERLAGTTQHNVAAAFLMGLHPRLGSTSPVATLDENIASIILNFLFRVPSQMEAKRLLESLLAPPPSVSERDRPLVGLIQYVASQCWQIDGYRSTHPILYDGMMTAILHHFLYQFHQLVAAGANPHAAQVLHAAVTSDLPPIFLKHLVVNGVSVNARDSAGCSPLHLVAKNLPYRSSLVHELLALGADPCLRDARGKTALEYADGWCAIDSDVSEADLGFEPDGARYETILVLAQAVAVEDKLSVFAQGAHPRLGAECPFRLMDSAVMGLVIDSIRMHLNKSIDPHVDLIDGWLSPRMYVKLQIFAQFTLTRCRMLLYGAEWGDVDTEHGDCLDISDSFGILSGCSICAVDCDLFDNSHRCDDESNRLERGSTSLLQVTERLEGAGAWWWHFVPTRFPQHVGHDGPDVCEAVPEKFVLGWMQVLCASTLSL